MTYDFIAGEVLLINKPLRWTSFQAVNKLKFAINRYLKQQEKLNRNVTSSALWPKPLTPNSQPLTPNPPKLKIGHAGTLDPLATGLLIICTGKMTKQIEQFQGQEKEYIGRFFMGATTPCYDLEMEPDCFFETAHITPEMIFETAKRFTGKIQQAPPAHSAIMIEGKRAYELARKGKEFEIKLKEVTIHEFEITGIEMPYIAFRVVCSKGTYIRSLANDFGKALNSGAYLAELCRTRIGSYSLHEALLPEELVRSLENHINKGIETN